MFSIITKADNWLLEQGDSFILWLWNTFSFPRISVIRIFVLMWVLLQLVVDISKSNGHLPIFSIVITIFLLGITALHEYFTAIMTPRALNEKLLATRNANIGWRLMMLIIGISLILTKEKTIALTITSQIGNVAFIIWAYLSVSLVPEEPPVKKIEEIGVEYAKSS